ncbi:MAG: family 10 glycosylhydrolase [Bryobacterales bacterium]|nr:family 10 glycosylhydrolase [Bryobacterales bacterium]
MPIFLLLLTAALAQAQQYRAFWADAFHSGYKSPAEVDQLIENLTAARANAIFVQTRRRADVYYRSEVEPPAQDATLSPNFDALGYLIERAHRAGIEVHAWAVVYPVWPGTIAPPRDPNHLYYRHGPAAPPEQQWWTMSSTGVRGASLDPGHPDVMRYLAKVILEPLEKYDVDGVHLDYIRYPEDASYGYNWKAMERFLRQENRAVIPARNDPQFSEFRRKQVTSLMRQIYLRAHALKPAVKVSAALITWGNGPLTDAAFRGTDAYVTVFQDWVSWMQEGILDLGMPMNYFRERTNASFFDRWIEFQKDRQFQRGILIGPAVYLNPIADSIAQLRRALAPSAAGNTPLGVSFYSYATTNLETAGAPTEPNADFYNAVGAFFGTRAEVPQLPWLTQPTAGHLMGEVRIAGAADWADGLTVRIESDTREGEVRQVTTDGTGFFGAVDLAPDRYRVTVERSGVLWYRFVPQDVIAGRVTKFEVDLKPEDLPGMIPTGQ